MRLLHISAVKPQKLKSFFDFNNKELGEVVQDLIDKGDIYLSSLGELELTEQATGYFDDIGSQPTLSAVLDYSESLTYEMIGLNCLGPKQKFSRWKNGISLKAESKELSNSEQLVNKKFQQDFYQYLDNGWMDHIIKNEKSKPTIYSIDLIKKIGHGATRLSIDFELDSDGNPIEFGKLKEFTDGSVIEISIGKRLSELNLVANLDSIVKSMMKVADKKTIDYISSSSINVAKLIQNKSKLLDVGSAYIPMIGQLYSKENATLITSNLSSFINRLKKIKQFTPRKLIWISPTNSVWGASSRTSKFWGSIETLSLVSDGKQDQRVYSPELYLPITDKGDRHTISKWKSEFGDKSTLFGLSEGFLEGNTEVLLLEGVFAIVNYHVVLPSYSPLPVPVGFMTTDLDRIEEISSIASEYVGDIKSFDNPNNFGKLVEL